MTIPNLSYFFNKIGDVSIICLPPRSDLGNLFCSECAAGALRHVGRFATRNPSQWSPAALCYAGWVARSVFRLPRCVVERGRVVHLRERAAKVKAELDAMWEADE